MHRGDIKGAPNVLLVACYCNKPSFGISGWTINERGAVPNDDTNEGSTCGKDDDS